MVQCVCGDSLVTGFVRVLLVLFVLRVLFVLFRDQST